jgi:hypothetical protein
MIAVAQTASEPPIIAYLRRRPAGERLGWRRR